MLCLCRQRITRTCGANRHWLLLANVRGHPPPTNVSRTAVFPSNLRRCISPMIPAANRVLVLASDGLWDAVDNEEATEVALKWQKRGAEYAAQALCMEAYARGSQDNITAVVSLCGWMLKEGSMCVCLCALHAVGALGEWITTVPGSWSVAKQMSRSLAQAQLQGRRQSNEELAHQPGPPCPLRAPWGRSYFFVPPPRPNSSATARLAAVAAAWRRWLSSAGTASLDRWRLPTLPALPPSVPRWGVVGLVAAAAVAAGANWRWPAALAPT